MFNYDLFDFFTHLLLNCSQHLRGKFVRAEQTHVVLHRTSELGFQPMNDTCSIDRVLLVSFELELEINDLVCLHEFKVRLRNFVAIIVVILVVIFIFVIAIVTVIAIFIGRSRDETIVPRWTFFLWLFWGGWSFVECRLGAGVGGRHGTSGPLWPCRLCSH